MIKKFSQDDFWSMIHEAKLRFWHDTEASATWLTSQLEELGPVAALRFHIIMQSYLDIADKCGLWDAAMLLCRGCSDDGFLYFRGWLIAQGKEVYLAAMKDPDSLADVEPYAGCRFESLCYVGTGAYETLTGNDTCGGVLDEVILYETELLSDDVVLRDGIMYPRDMKGIAAYYPRLWAKYGNQMPATGCRWNLDDSEILMLFEEGRRADLKRIQNTPVLEDRNQALVLQKYGKTYPIRVRVNTYANYNNLAIERDVQIDGDWHGWDTLTVNLIPCTSGPNYAFLDTNDCGEDCVEWLINNGFGRPTGIRESSGFCTYPEFQFSEEKLRAVDAEGYEEHVKQWEKCYGAREKSGHERGEKG